MTREINNNVEISKMKKADFKIEKNEEVKPQFTGDSEIANVQDFSNPSEVLGRSQVNSTDNLKADIAFSAANPSAIENSDKLFEVAFKGLQESDDLNAYEKACSIATGEDAKTLFSK